jgi:alkylation response protein AidB-like acyl-CoA dehydrogenase
LKARLLPRLASGELFATVGISHLTTSRRHLGRPVLTAEAISGGFRLNRMSPWVTGGGAADYVVLAAVLVEAGEVTDKQLLISVPGDTPGVKVAEALPLIGVSASSTGPGHLSDAEISDEWLIAGPMPHALSEQAARSRVSRQGDDAEPLRMTLHDIERTLADTAGRTQTRKISKRRHARAASAQIVSQRRRRHRCRQTVDPVQNAAVSGQN